MIIRMSILDENTTYRDENRSNFRKKAYNIFIHNYFILFLNIEFTLVLKNMCVYLEISHTTP